MVFLGLVFMIMFIAWLLRELLEAVMAPVFDNTPTLQQWRWLQIYIAIVAAIGLAIFYRLDIVYVVAGYTRVDWSPFLDVTHVGMVLTGGAIGMGSNFIHKLIEYVVDQRAWLRNLVGKNGDES